MDTILVMKGSMLSAQSCFEKDVISLRTDIVLRLETPEDYASVESLTRDAFWNVHVPGCSEHYLVHVLRDAEAFVPELDFVALHDSKIVGNIMYAKSLIEGDDGEKHPVLTFGPVSVAPLMQRQGIGGMLIRHSLERARELGFTAVLIYGDPGFYGRFGFLPAESFQIGTADNFYADALQALELTPGALKNCAGRFFEGPAYDVDEAAAAAFDERFLKKGLKDDLPSQRRFRELLKLRKPRGID